MVDRHKTCLLPMPGGSDASPRTIARTKAAELQILAISWLFLGKPIIRAGDVLLDRTNDERPIVQIWKVIKVFDGVRIVDLHVWRLGTGHYGAIVSLLTKERFKPEFFKERLCGTSRLSHLTVEVN